MDVSLLHMAAQTAYDTVSMAHTMAPDPSSFVGPGVGHHVAALEPQVQYLAKSSEVDLSGMFTGDAPQLHVKLSDQQQGLLRKLAGVLFVVWMIVAGYRFAKPPAGGQGAGRSPLQSLGGWKTILGAGLGLIILFDLEAATKVLNLVIWASYQLFNLLSSFFGL